MRKFRLPIIPTDGYKTGHHLMYPENTVTVVSNFTPRNVKYMHEMAKSIVVFGVQYALKKIVDLFDDEFFLTEKREELKKQFSLTSELSKATFEIELEELKQTIIKPLKEELDSHTGSDYDVTHFSNLWDLGYLPIEVRALEEGTVLHNANIPILTYFNVTKQDTVSFFWVTNFLESVISAEIWKPMHSASISFGARKLVNKYAKETDQHNLGATNFQNHDFSFRGMQGLESAMASGLGFLTCSMGTDTLPALAASEYYYNTRDAAHSVFATEHAVMTAYGKETEIDGFRRLIKLFPNGILSMVADSYDFFKIHSETLYELKDEIMARDGKLVLRGDSGDPVEIICGIKIPSFSNLSDVEDYFYKNVNGNLVFRINESVYKVIRHSGSDFRYEPYKLTPEEKGQIELLWECFGGTINDQGYKVLDSHIGAIYGDGINFERAVDIMERLKEKGFASTNITLGWGSYSMGYATRDNQGSAVKATYIEKLKADGTIEGINIFKDPKTDPGKKSAKGLLKVIKDADGNYSVKDECTWDEVNADDNELKVIFRNGKFVKETTLIEVRERLEKLM